MLFSNHLRNFSRVMNRVPQRRVKPVLLSICCIVVFGFSSYGYNFSFRLEDLSCYSDTKDDVLLPAEKRTFSEDSIFFHQTSCREGLNTKETCAVEAVARANTDWAVHVLLSAPVKSSVEHLKVFEYLSNVQVSRLHIKEYVKGTIAENVFDGDALQKGNLNVHNILKFVTLYKWGGVYLDFDTLVVKSLNSLAQNWFIKDTENYKMYDGAISLTHKDPLGRIIAVKLLRDSINFCGEQCSNGQEPPSTSKALKEFCTYNSHSLISNSCKGLIIYSSEMFAPITKMVPYRDFVNDSLIWPLHSYYHIWDTRKADSIKVGTGFAKLANQYCPNTFNTFSEDFGSETENNSTIFLDSS